MHPSSLSHLANSTLKHHLEDLVIADRGTTARLLAHMAEFQSRKLYLEDGYPSMYAYCLGELRMSEDVACKRIRAAKAARRFPAILVGLAEGTLHLSGVALLMPHLTEATAGELLAAAEHKTRAEIELLLAERFPRQDLPTVLEALSPTPSPGPSPQPAPAWAPPRSPAHAGNPASPRIGSPGELPAPGRVEAPVPPPVVTPLAPRRFAWQLTVSQETQDLLRDVQDLLGHDVPPGDLEAVLHFSLRAAKQKLEQRKFAATERPRAGHRRSNPDGRHIPAEVRRAVWQRDGGQCTFTSDRGHRCEERRDLQFDHIDPYARGGTASIGGIRLLCRAHNQHEAERVFGPEFMRHKREAARIRASEERVRSPSSVESAG